MVVLLSFPPAPADKLQRESRHPLKREWLDSPIKSGNDKMAGFPEFTRRGGIKSGNDKTDTNMSLKGGQADE